MVSLANPYRAVPYVLNRDTAPAFWLVGTLWLPMATAVQTGNRFSFIEQLMPIGLGPPTHRHPWADEGFYVLEGVCSFNAAGATVRAGPGSFVHLPRMTPHSFSVDTEEARVVNFYAPAGFELCVMSLARPTDDLRRPSIEEAPPPSTPGALKIPSDLFGQEEVRALPFAVPSSEPLMATSPPDWTTAEVHTASSDTAPTYEAFGMTWRMLAASTDTAGSYDLFDALVPPTSSLHRQILLQDSAIYVLDGELELELELSGRTQAVGSGSFAYVPAGSPHMWRTRIGRHVCWSSISQAASTWRWRDMAGMTHVSQLTTRFGRSLEQQAQASWNRVQDAKRDGQSTKRSRHRSRGQPHSRESFSSGAVFVEARKERSARHSLPVSRPSSALEGSWLLVRRAKSGIG